MSLQYGDCVRSVFGWYGFIKAIHAAYAIAVVKCADGTHWVGVEHLVKVED